MKLLITILIALVCTFSVFAQEKPRTLVKSEHYHAGAPVEIVEISLRGTRINFNETQMVASNWVGGLSFKVKNVSAKTITFFNIGLEVPASENNPYRLVFPVRFSVPLHIDDAGVAHPTDLPKLLLPNATIDVKVHDQSLKAFSSHLGKLGADDFDKLIVDIEEVQFNDDTGWSHGWEWKRIPTNRNKRVRLNDSSGRVSVTLRSIIDFLLLTANGASEKESFFLVGKPHPSYSRALNPGAFGIQAPRHANV